MFDQQTKRIIRNDSCLRIIGQTGLSSEYRFLSEIHDSDAHFFLAIIEMSVYSGDFNRETCNKNRSVIRHDKRNTYFQIREVDSFDPEISDEIIEQRRSMIEESSVLLRKMRSPLPDATAKQEILPPKPPLLPVDGNGLTIFEIAQFALVSSDNEIFELFVRVDNGIDQGVAVPERGGVKKEMKNQLSFYVDNFSFRNALIFSHWSVSIQTLVLRYLRKRITINEFWFTLIEMGSNRDSNLSENVELKKASLSQRETELIDLFTLTFKSHLAVPAIIKQKEA